MAKIRSVFLIFIFCFFCFTLSFVGCKRNFVYPYMYDITQIVEIKIGVKKEETVNNISIDDRYDIKTEIVDKEEFFKDFENLKFNYNFPGDLITIKPNEYVIIFIYENGNSEEVHWGAQFRIIEGNGKSGRVHCDERSFKELISKWCE